MITSPPKKLDEIERNGRKEKKKKTPFSPQYLYT
jgi:hypothetical protein